MLYSQTLIAIHSFVTLTVCRFSWLMREEELRVKMLVRFRRLMLNIVTATKQLLEACVVRLTRAQEVSVDQSETSSGLKQI